jgi:hypothetical protein
MLSLAVPYHGDRLKWLSRTIENIYSIAEITEIIIAVDKSEHPSNDLQEFAKSYSKIKIFINDTTLLAFHNKIKVVQLSNSPWVILLDSDNVIDKEYVFRFLGLEKNETTIYQPSKALPNFDYTSLVGMVIDMGWVKSHINEIVTSTMFNTGNYIFHRKEWLEAVGECLCNYEPYGVDVAYANYLCLKRGLNISVVKGLEYEHAVHEGSSYIKYSNQSKVVFEKLKKIIEDL